MLNVRLADGDLYGKQLFTWLSLVVSLMASLFVLSFFPLDVLDEILDVIESVSEGFLAYSQRRESAPLSFLEGWTPFHKLGPPEMQRGIIVVPFGKTDRIGRLSTEDITCD